MKNLYILGILASIIYISSCQLEPLPYPETFETLVEPTGLVLNNLVDGVELSNGDIIVIGTAKNQNIGDLFIARIDLNGKVVDSKTFDSGGDDDISAICKDDEDELYIVGKNATKNKGIVFKISPKSKTFTQVWLKDDITVENCTTFKQVQFFNNLIYIIHGTRNGDVGTCNTSSFITLNKDKALQNCTRIFGRINPLAAVIGNGKLFYAGENGIKSTLVGADCSSPKLIYSNLESYNHIRGLAASANELYIGGNIYISPTSSKTFLTKINWSNLAATTQISITNATLNQIDSTANKRYYYLTSMTTTPNGIVYAANFGYNGDATGYTQLKRFASENINTSQLKDVWDKKNFIITTSKLINSNYQSHGGYILIGQKSDKGKVIKVNRVGEL